MDIEKIAKEEWDKLQQENPGDGLVQEHPNHFWEYWLKAMEVALSKFEYTKDDMKTAHRVGFISAGDESDEDRVFNKWLRKYEIWKQGNS